MRAEHLLFVSGADRPVIDEQGRLHGSPGSTDLYKLLGPMIVARVELRPNYLRGRPAPPLEQFTRVFNSITDPEQNPQVLDVLERILRGYKGRVINHPRAVRQTSRDKVAKLLEGIPGLVVPRTIRVRARTAQAALSQIERAALRPPILLRRAGTHTGNFIGRFDRVEDMAPHLPVEGDLFATEFIDFASADGLYRKHRIYFIDGRRVHCHMVAMPDWNVHYLEGVAFMANHPELIDGDRALFSEPEGAYPPAVSAALNAIGERIAADFFGVDFGILPDGRAILFEANATMTFLPLLAGETWAYKLKCVPPATRAMASLFGIPDDQVRFPAVPVMPAPTL